MESAAPRLLGQRRLRSLFTARNKAKDQCRDAEERFRLGFEGASTGIAMADLEGRFTTVNPAMCHILGRSRDQVVGHFVDEFTHPDDVALTTALFDVGADSPIPMTEKRYVKPDGTVVRAQLNLTLVRPETGERPYFFTQVQDITDQKQAEADLERNVLHDTVTGLPGHALLTDRLRHALEQAQGNQAQVGVILVGLDGVNMVNEAFGYPAGDAVLVEVANRLTGALRAGDTVGRLGGDEFLVVWDEVDGTVHARQLADRLRSLLSEAFSVGEEQVTLTVSLGVTVANATGTAEDAIRDATAALCRAKQRGRGNVETFEPSPHGRRATNQFRARADLRRALDNEEMHVVYEPLVDLDIGRVVAAEALVRWDDPERGAVPPSEFVPLAEQVGLISEVGDWVLRRVCAELPEIYAAVDARVPVSVNVSACQLSEPSLDQRFGSILRASGIDPHSIMFEVTETALITNAVTARETLRGFQGLGARVALDDFGTGYSSLASIRLFPIDVLKIDASFIAGLGVDANDTVIVEAVLNLAHTLGLTVVAQGVERQAQVEELQRLNCRYAQGFLWSPAVPVGPFVELLARALWGDSTKLAEGNEGFVTFEPVAVPRSVLDSLPFSTAILDHSGSVIATNLAWKRFGNNVGAARAVPTGVSANYLAVCDAARGDGSDVAATVAAGIRAVLAGERENFNTAYLCQAPSGARWFDVIVAPMRLAGGGAVVMHVETTERRQAEEALRVSEVTARATFERAPIGIVRIDPAGRIAEVNGAFAEMAGRSRQELEGADPSVVWHPDMAEQYRDELNGVLKGGRSSYSTERRFVRPDGSVRYAHVNTSIVRFENDVAAPFVIATAEDQTERRELTEQLRRAQELEAVGRLAGGIAHEINTPTQFIGSNLSYLRDAFNDLNSVVSVQNMVVRAARSSGATELSTAASEAEAQAELLALDQLVAEIPAAISEAAEGVDRVASIVRALKAFGHPDQGQAAPTDLNEALRNTLVVARNEYKYVADVETDFGEIPLLTCYAGELNQAFLNLVVNAADAIREVVGDSGDRGCITVRTRCDGDHILISIRDTGCGIPEDVGNKVFQPFFTTKEIGRGTGQGLGVVRAAVVDRHRGQVSFESSPGQGTCFMLKLPLTSPVPIGTADHEPEMSRPRARL